MPNKHKPLVPCVPAGLSLLRHQTTDLKLRSVDLQGVSWVSGILKDSIRKSVLYLISIYYSMLYIKSTFHFVGLNLSYLMTLFDTLQYLSLFANKKQKEYEHKKGCTKAYLQKISKKRVQMQKKKKSTKASQLPYPFPAALTSPFVGIVPSKTRWYN